MPDNDCRNCRWSGTYCNASTGEEHKVCTHPKHSFGSQYFVYRPRCANENYHNDCPDIDVETPVNIATAVAVTLGVISAVLLIVTVIIALKS